MDIFNILRDYDKLRIVLYLIDDEICVCDLEVLLGLKQSTLSNKLRTLRSAEIISVRKEKNWHYYSLNPTFYQEHIKLIEYIQEMNDSLIFTKSQCKEKNGK